MIKVALVYPAVGLLDEQVYTKQAGLKWKKQKKSYERPNDQAFID
jgi:hypothetical protein